MKKKTREYNAEETEFTSKRTPPPLPPPQKTKTKQKQSSKQKKQLSMREKKNDINMYGKRQGSIIEAS